MARILSASLMGLVLSAPARAVQETRPGPAEMRLKLGECIELALRHNLDVEISRYQPWIDDQSVESAFGPFDHVFYADGSGGRSRFGAASVLQGAPEVNDEAALFKTGVRRTLPMGAEFDIGLSIDRRQTNSAFVLLDPTWEESVDLTLTVPVLKGAGQAVLETPILLARNARRSSVAELEKVLADTVVAVQEAYWALVSAIEQKRFREQSLDVARRLLDENKRRLDRGFLTKVDVTMAESGVASQVEGILTADKEVQDAMDRLKELIDPSLLRREVFIRPVDSPPATAEALDEGGAVERGFRESIGKRPELRSASVQVESQERLIEKARNDVLPSFNLIAAGSYTGIEDSFGGAAQELGAGDTYAWTVGFSLEFRLENREADGALRKAELERRRLLLQRRRFEDRILVEVRETVRGIKTAEKRIEATRQAAVLAREQFEGEEGRRDQGMRTTFHVLDARAKLTEALTNEVRSRVDYATAWARHRRATGTLLGHHGIVVEANLAPRSNGR